MSTNSGHDKIKTISILGSGWLGLPLAESLMASGYTVKLSTRDQQKKQRLSNSANSVHIIDIDSQRFDPEFFDCDCLIINITSKNITGFKQLIDIIEQSPVRYIIFTSSTSVYQNNQHWADEAAGLIEKDSPLFQIEQLFRNSRAFKTSIIRLAGLIGGARHPGYFFKNKPVPSPSAPVNLIHQADCIAIINSIIKQHYWGQTINACADSHPTKKQFYSYARSLTELPPLQFAQDEKKHYKMVSNGKIKKALNYQFIYPDLMQIPF